MGRGRGVRCGLGGDGPGRASLLSPAALPPLVLSSDSLLTPGGQEPPYLNELLRGGEAAHTERHKDPAPGVAALGGVVSELLADLTVDLIPRQAEKQGRETASEKPSPAQPLVGHTTCCPLPLALDHPGGSGLWPAWESYGATKRVWPWRQMHQAQSMLLTPIQIHSQVPRTQREVCLWLWGMLAITLMRSMGCPSLSLTSWVA